MASERMSERTMWAAVVITSVLAAGAGLPLRAQDAQPAPVKDPSAVTLQGATSGAQHSWTTD